MNIGSKVEIILAMKDYNCEERQKVDGGIDIIASDGKSDDRVLLRIINEPKSKAGIVGRDAVLKLNETLKSENYDKGILISKRFTVAARQEMRRKDIQMVSEKVMPSFKPEELYIKMQNYIDDLCKVKCGKVPEKESDCKGYSEGCYSCKVRLISDDFLFHFERGWTDLVQNDLRRLCSILYHE